MTKFGMPTHTEIGPAWRCAGLAALMMIALLGWIAAPAQAENTPDRGLSGAFNHPGLIIGPEESVDLPLTVRNTGRQDDSFTITVVEKPDNWQTDLWAFSKLVTGLFLPGGDQGELVLTATPPTGQPLPPGPHRFKIKFASLDGHLNQESTCLVTVRSRQTGRPALTIATTHPAVRGPSDSRFSFSLDVGNQSEEDTLVGLSATTPTGWEAYFKPSYEDKQVSSIQIPKGQSRAISLDLKPDYRAQAGRYPILVRAESKGGTAEITLTVELTGTYQIKLIPANELLSAATEPGQAVALGFFLLNEGSATQRNVKFVALAPDNWRIKIEPESLPELAPGRTPIPVTLTVTPAEDALVGDYGLALAAEGERSKSALDLRLTVKAKTAWAWAGIGLIIATVAGLAILFRSLSRR